MIFGKSLLNLWIYIYEKKKKRKKEKKKKDIIKIVYQNLNIDNDIY